MTAASENTIAVFRIPEKVIARRSADNSITIRLFVSGLDLTAAFDADEVTELATWLACRVEEVT
jgi:hypothetical protein